uniref:Uncharacterized protein n=1 Tax=Glossina austeni TaxID=7395 RepID=A0A1A9UFN9_GLOAU
MTRPKIIIISSSCLLNLLLIVLRLERGAGGEGDIVALVDLSKLKLRWWTDSSGYVGATRHTSKIQIQLYILYLSLRHNTNQVTNALRNGINPFRIITITKKNKTQKQQWKRQENLYSD